MVQNIFRRLINEIYIEYFKPNGWKKQGSNYRYIDDSGLGKIINFQKSKWNDVDNIEFKVNENIASRMGMEKEIPATPEISEVESKAKCFEKDYVDFNDALEDFMENN